MIDFKTEKINGIQVSERLVDERNGKNIDWQELKKSNMAVAEVYRHISEDFSKMISVRLRKIDSDSVFEESFLDFYGGDFSVSQMERISEIYYKKYESMKSCNRELLFGVKKGDSFDDKKLLWCHSCRDRYCALCQHKTSRVRAYRTSKIVQTMKKRYDDINFIFLTLTVKNVERDGKKLKDTVRKMNKAFHKMLNYSAITGSGLRGESCENQVVKGTMKKLEITYNRREGKFHPHFHVLLAVGSEYFTPEYYLSQKRWRNIWKKAMGLSYDPYVYVEMVSKNSKKMNSVQAAAYEITKYVTKSKDIVGDGSMTHWEDKGVLFALNELKGMRFYSFSGLFKEIRSELFGNREEITDEELVNADDLSEDEINDYILFTYRWNFSKNDYLIWANNQRYLGIYFDWRKQRRKVV